MKPYRITNKIVKLVASVSEKIGEVNSSYQIRSATAAGLKRIPGPGKDVLEAKNTINAYKRLADYKPYSLKSFCKAHEILMKGLDNNAGKLRNKSADKPGDSGQANSVLAGNMVHSLMKDLFDYIKNAKNILLLKSCVFHYETGLILPFADGNLRIAMLWQTVLLRQYSPVFEFISFESLIKENQNDYYRFFEDTYDGRDSTRFIEFMLQIINDSLGDLLTNQKVKLSARDRVDIFREKSGSDSFTRLDYMRYLKDISPATASRDLKEAVDSGILEKSGDKRTTNYLFK